MGILAEARDIYLNACLETALHNHRKDLNVNIRWFHVVKLAGIDGAKIPEYDTGRHKRGAISCSEVRV